MFQQKQTAQKQLTKSSDDFYLENKNKSLT